MKYKIEVRYVETKVYEVCEERWQEAVDTAAVLAEMDGLDIVGGVAVYDENGAPVDTR